MSAKHPSWVESTDANLALLRLLQAASCFKGQKAAYKGFGLWLVYDSRNLFLGRGLLLLGRCLSRSCAGSSSGRRPCRGSRRLGRDLFGDLWFGSSVIENTRSM